MKKNLSKLNKGMSTLEILLAFAILILAITAVIGMVFGNQSITVDAETNTEALTKATQQLEEARADSRKDFFSVISQNSTPDSIYTKELTIEDLTPCKKQATSTITWNTDGGRAQTIELGTFLTDIAGALALGGDCAIDAPFGGWNPPKPFASYKFNPGNPISIDVLNRIVYMVDDMKKLNIVDTSDAYLNFNGDFISPPFDAGINLNDIDVSRWVDPESGLEKFFAYVVRDEYPNQFQVIDVTDITAPTSTPSTMIKPLEGTVPPDGEFSEGWRVFYYDNFAYVVTRETLGREFHIFNVERPTAPEEVGPGYEVNGTTNDFVVTGITVNSLERRIAYLATSRSSMEIMALDVTNPINPRFLTSFNLLPDQGSNHPNALSIFIIGNRLYVGREESNFSDELFVFKISPGVDAFNNLTVSLSPIGSQNMAGDVKYLIVSGKFAFIAVDTPQNEFQVWDISKPEISINRIDLTTYNLPNKIDGGMDYEYPYVYIGSLAGDPLQILYSQ